MVSLSSQQKSSGHGAPLVRVITYASLPAARRARWLVPGIAGAVSLTYVIYLLAFEANFLQRPFVRAFFSLVVSLALTCVLASSLHVLSRRIWFSVTMAMGLILLLAAWAEIKLRMSGASLTVVDILIIDPATLAFALRQPDFFWHFAGFVLLVALAAAVFFIERPASGGHLRRVGPVVLCSGFLGVLLFSGIRDPWRDVLLRHDDYHLTYFARSLAVGAEYFRRSGIVDRIDPGPAAPAPAASLCHATAGKKLPHIIVILDEASIDTTRFAHLQTDPGLRNHFRSFDGTFRSLRVETFGLGTWRTEVSVLTGLSTRSFGPFSMIVTRMIADRVNLSLPEWLRQCGYETRSIYPAGGSFMSARRLHDGLKVEHFEDVHDIQKRAPFFSSQLQLRDREYYKLALDRLEQRQGKPVFTFLWLTGNHAPWREQLSPEEKAPGAKGTANPEINEYVRRQHLSQRDFAALKRDLAKRFPGEPFLILRFGDHLPFMGGNIVDPDLPEGEVRRKVEAYDPAYYTTYYAVDTVNYKPAGKMPSHDTTAAAYLGLVILKLAGLPYNPAAQFQAPLLERCEGLFIECDGGDAAKRFNGWLLRHGLMTGL